MIEKIKKRGGSVRHKWLIAIVLNLIFLTSCYKNPVSSYKVVLVQDSSNKSASISPKGQKKSVYLAIENFLSQTDIKGLPLELETIDLAQANITDAKQLERYINKLQNGVKKTSALIGFIIENQENNQTIWQFQKILGNTIGNTDWLVIGSWPNDSSTRQEMANISQNLQNPSPLWINLFQSVYQRNEYILKYLVEQQNLGGVYLIYDEDHRNLAQDFSARSQSFGLTHTIPLQYNPENSQPSQDSLPNLEALPRAPKIPSNNTEQKNGIVLLLNQNNTDKSNTYLAQSPNRVFFEQFDIFLIGTDLNITTLENPQTLNYFIIQPLQEESRQKNYQRFQQQYETKYHLKAGIQSAVLYDATSLLAHTAQKIIDKVPLDSSLLSKKLYQSLLQSQWTGSTGHVIFDAEGKRMTQYVVSQWTANGFSTP